MWLVRWNQGPFGQMDVEFCLLAFPLLFGEADRDLDELVFLAADELAAARLDEDRGAGHAVLPGLDVGMLEEARVDAGVAHREREPVELALGRHDRADHLLGGVDDLEGGD